MKSMSLANRLSLVAVLIVGCADTKAVSPGTAASTSHGGTSVALPDGKGYAEILVEKPSAAKTSKKTQGIIVAYFVNADGSGPITPSPTAVSFKPSSGAALSLNPQGERFTSAAGPFNPGRELDGDLSATIEGQAVSVSFVTR